MKALELRAKPPQELATLLREREVRRDELAGLIRQQKVKNVRELRLLRSEIARIYTIIHEAKTRV